MQNEVIFNMKDIIMYTRLIETSIRQKLFKGKVIILIGARQVGKTTLLKSILKDEKYLFLNGDETIVRERLKDTNTSELSTIFGESKIVYIDEAQRIDNIGLTAKIIHDNFPDKQLILSGSSAFELKNITNEPLTGRKWTFNLYPFSFEEIEQKEGFIEALKQLETRLIYGSYPDVVNHPGQEREILKELTDSYLYKDILAFSGIQKPKVLENILKALAFQVGNEVSINEVAKLVGVDKNTVEKYIYLLQLSYVIFPLNAFSRNLRNEIKKSRKFYFYDNGVRNALIYNYNPIQLRDDIGALWENYLVAERLKRNHYANNYTASYFWRTTQQQEIDYIEEQDGNITAYEFKWNPKKKARLSKTFTRNYDAEVKVIHRENFHESLKL